MTSSPRNAPRPWYRRVGLGKKWLWLRHKAHLGFWRSMTLSRSREPNLAPISDVKPAHTGTPQHEVHMLLGHSRIREGLWTLLSFAHLVDEPIYVVVHDDGSLDEHDRRLLAEKLPQLRVVSRVEASSATAKIFQDKRLTNCVRFRDSFVLARKVFDPPIFAKASTYIMLDSDVLFFRRPDELLSRIGGSEIAAPLYSTDNGFRYSFDANELHSLIGMPPLSQLNSGILRVNSDTVDFDRVEAYLDHPGFWKPDGVPDYYAEMTILALELTRKSALPLSDGYAIAPDPEDTSVIAGHYCGGIRSAYTYYVRALPRVQSLLAPRLIDQTSRSKAS